MSILLAETIEFKPHNQPRTYWERRALINEKVLHQIMWELGVMYPELQDVIKDIGEAWQRTTDNLDEEFKNENPGYRFTN